MSGHNCSFDPNCTMKDLSCSTYTCCFWNSDTYSFRWAQFHERIQWQGTAVGRTLKMFQNTSFYITLEIHKQIWLTAQTNQNIQFQRIKSNFHSFAQITFTDFITHGSSSKLQLTVKDEDGRDSQLSTYCTNNLKVY